MVTMACGFTVNVPLQDFKLGPTQQMEINVPAPDSDIAQLTLEFGAGELILNPGTQDALVQGTAIYNAEQLKPVITTNGNQVKIATGNLDIHGVPTIRAKNFKNEWDLQLGNQIMVLKLNAGAYRGNIDLGGLAITSLEINDGAADVNLTFNQPNPAEMQRLLYSTGASSVNLRNLANANFSELIFRSGAGSYLLDFSGELQRDASVVIESGVSQVTVSVPTGVAAEVLFTGGLSNVEVQGQWKASSSGTYTLEGNGPKLSITVTMGAGNLVLEN
jgi:hypothetical protein